MSWCIIYPVALNDCIEVINHTYNIWRRKNVRYGNAASISMVSGFQGSWLR